MKRRLLVSAIGLGMAAILATVVVNSVSAPTPVLATVPVGMIFACPVVDAEAGRALVFDNGVIDQLVTLQSGGVPRWSSNTTSVHVIDTRSGALVATVATDPLVSALAVDPYTDRAFAAEQSAQAQVIDVRRGQILGGAPYNGDPAIVTTLPDRRSGHLFVSTAFYGLTVTDMGQHVLMLDGRTGRTLRTLTFPPATRLTTRASNGTALTDDRPSLSLALDGAAGRLYVFSPDRRMSVLDTASGRLLLARRLRVPLAGETIDAHTGRVFAFDASRNPSVTGFSGRQYPRPLPGTLVMLDARSGAILRKIPAGTTASGSDAIALDEGANRVFVANRLRRTITVLDAANGTLMHTIAFDSAVGALALDARHHRLVVDTGGGHGLTVLDTRRGALLRTISLSQQLQCLTLDARSGHLIAISSVPVSAVPDRWAWLPMGVRARLPGIPPPPLDSSQRIMRNTVLTLDVSH